MDKWISVKDRLPKDMELVLTCDKYGYMHVFHHRHDFSDPFGIGPDHLDYNPVLYWLPLPDPPKEET